MTRSYAPANVSKRSWISGAVVAAAAVLATTAAGTGMLDQNLSAAASTPTPGRATTQQVAFSTATDQHVPTFSTLNDAKDPTFNQLLGINDGGRIAGYFGSGADVAHPNKGFTVKRPYAQQNFVDQNVPGSVQTQVIGINNDNVTVGFAVDGAGATSGFVRREGRFTRVVAPGAGGATPVTQLLGVNNRGTAVGFYNDANGTAHGFTYRLGSGRFTDVTVPVHADAVTATGINDRGDLCGFYSVRKSTFGFEIVAGRFRQLSFGAARNTQALGINASDQVVGSYLDVDGTTRGFLWSHHRLITLSAPNAVGVGGTVVNGLNNRGQLVGFYVDAAGNTNGMLVKNAS